MSDNLELPDIYAKSSIMFTGDSQMQSTHSMYSLAPILHIPQNLPFLHIHYNKR